MRKKKDILLENYIVLLVLIWVHAVATNITTLISYYLLVTVLVTAKCRTWVQLRSFLVVLH
jgi:hypothetical protein